MKPSDTSSKPKKQQYQPQQHTGVVIVAPDGEVIKIGKTLLDDYEKDKYRKKDDNVVYRLYDKVPPYLYYTNKLDNNLNINYQNETLKEDSSDPVKLTVEHDGI